MARSSPAFSGGLIEAWPSANCIRRAAVSSPAFSGGLIEADKELDKQRKAILIFPRIQRGPH